MSQAMESVKKSDVTTKGESVTIITNNNGMVPLSVVFIPYFKTLQNMIEDLKDQKQIPLPYDAELVQKLFELVELKSTSNASKVSLVLHLLSEITLAKLLALANYLECPYLFNDLLLKLAKKIAEERLTMQDEIIEELDQILPHDLLVLVNELVLMKHKQMDRFIKITQHIEQKKEWDLVNFAIFFNKDRNFLYTVEEPLLGNVSVMHSCHVYKIIDEKIILFDYFENSRAEFSPDGKYLLIKSQTTDRPDCLLINLATNGRCKIPVNSLSEAGFSANSAALIINAAAYDVEKASLLDKNPYAAEKETELSLREEHNKMWRAAFSKRRIAIDEILPIVFTKEFHNVADQCDVICRQLPKTVESKSHLESFDFGTDGVNFLCIKLKHMISKTLKFWLFDITNPQDIRELLCLEDPKHSNCSLVRVSEDSQVIWLMHHHRLMRIIRKTGALCEIELKLDSFPKVFSVSKDNSTVILRYGNNNDVHFYKYIPSINELVKVGIVPTSKPIWSDSSSAHFLSDSGDSFIVADDNRFNPQKWEIAVGLVPFKLFSSRCSLKQLLMLIRRAEYKEQSSYSIMYATLDAEIRAFLERKAIEGKK